jgi:hypothetical protein
MRFYEGINIEALVAIIPDYPELQRKLIPSVMAYLDNEYGLGLTPLYCFVRNQSLNLEGRTTASMD